MAILNYTTKIDSYKTITEIQKILASKGAKKIIIDNDIAGNPIAITFQIYWNGNNIAFALPCNFEGVLKSLKHNNKVPKSLCTQEQALRVGWRIIKDWITSQMALIEAELASMVEIFLPYAITKNGFTIFKFIENKKEILSLENNNG